jgi:hypothetical protein
MLRMGVACAKTCNCLNLNLKKLGGNKNVKMPVRRFTKKLNIFFRISDILSRICRLDLPKKVNLDNHNTKATFIIFKISERNAYYGMRGQNFQKTIFLSESGK